ncbi:hypothetical protein P0Y43_04645 [Pseudomonas entomophila]|uniref:hypothetical protein n=1 Tax=Pseudomonas entomophila TaxID=312306 RepID=UPI0023D8BAB7|nr:hypothetical protein [Pseudomonas entomophila]MDF0730017.1 hypothetical protein [Pseudomonas entomophila]
MVQIDWNVIATGLIAPSAVLVVKTMLDFSLSHYFVKYLYWLPVRGFFRDRPPKLSGKWEQVWEAPGSPNFSEKTDRHSYTSIKQFGRYIYAEFDAKGKSYCIFGVIKNSYITGEWYDRDDQHAYFGTLQLKVTDSAHLEGLYIGHSHRTSLVGSGAWTWNRVSN